MKQSRVGSAAYNSPVSIRLKNQQRATTKRVKTVTTCLRGCQQLSAIYKVFPFLLDHELGKCDRKSVVTPLVSYTAAYFVSGLA